MIYIGGNNFNNMTEVAAYIIALQHHNISLENEIDNLKQKNYNQATMLMKGKSQRNYYDGTDFQEELHQVTDKYEFTKVFNPLRKQYEIQVKEKNT